MAWALVYKQTEDDIKALAIPEGQHDKIDQIVSQHNGITVKGVKITDAQIVGIFKQEEFKNLRATLLTPAPKTTKGKTWDDFKAEVEQSDWYQKAKATRIKGQTAKSLQQIRKAQGL